MTEHKPPKGADAPLLPCPFCGEQPTLVEYEEMDGLPAATIDCRACDQAGTRVHTLVAEVTAAWNRRASPIKAEVTTGKAELTDKELMRILRDADGGEALSVRLRPLYDTVWKDGIDIEQPSYLYKTLARRIAESGSQPSK